MLTVGEIVAGKYRIESILGQGGMGIVAVATHVQLDQKFALKVVHDAMSDDQSIVDRFMREARASAKLKSEHVCRVSDVDQLASGAPFIVMELLEGQDLQQIVRSQVLSLPVAADYVLQACIAIAEAHGAGIVHRDLKPANLFLTARMDGTPLIKVLDFGIAKAADTADLHLTQTQAIMGSPGYMSPEQLRSARDVDGRSDIWSLGVILYELTTGRLPFIGQTITELAVKVAIDPPAPLPATMDPRFAAIISRCLEKDIARRYQAVSELANDLAPYAGASGNHSASLIARLSGSQPGVSAPRSAVLPMATQLTGFSSTAPPTMATPPPVATEHVSGSSTTPRGPSATLPPGGKPRSSTTPRGPSATLPPGGKPRSSTTPRGPSATLPPGGKPRSSKKPLLVLGALALLGGAAFAGYALTRKSDPKAAKKAAHRDAGVQLDAAQQPDAGAGFETRELDGLRAQKKWTEIIALEKNGDPNDAALKAAVADARTAYTADTAARVAALVAASDCLHAVATAAAAKAYVDNTALVADAKKCGEKKVAGTGSGSGSGSGSAVVAPPPAKTMTVEEVRQAVDDGEKANRERRYTDALVLANKVLADHKDHAMASRVAGVASCQLGRAADAKKYYDQISGYNPRQLAARKTITSVCQAKGIKIE